MRCLRLSPVLIAEVVCPAPERDDQTRYRPAESMQDLLYLFLSGEVVGFDLYSRVALGHKATARYTEPS